MVGGTVVEICDIQGRASHLFVDVVDPKYPKQHCGVVLAKTQAAERIEIGDQLWWQAGNAYWSPQSPNQLIDLDTRRTGDIAIPKIGYSGVPHPLQS